MYLQTQLDNKKIKKNFHKTNSVLQKSLYAFGCFCPHLKQGVSTCNILYMCVQVCRATLCASFQMATSQNAVATALHALLHTVTQAKGEEVSQHTIN